MKKFLSSVLIGGLAGTALAFIFVWAVPQLPDFFASTFYQNIPKPTNIALALKDQFTPTSSQSFIQSVDTMVAQEGKVVYADLGAMKITLFENGQPMGEYEIASIGREGTAWQTPVGQFDMSYKIKNHFSSIGHVWMPYSMHFFGNYFIHGWPYDAAGTPVPEGYSGGCIRLETENARMIYEFVDSDTQLVVTSSANRLDASGEYTYEIQHDAPDISAAYVVADLESGEVMAAQNATQEVPAGSFASLMAGIISLETLNQYQQTVFEQEIVPISDLLYALLLSDSAEAGTLLQTHKNKHQYLLDMNTRAQSIGMASTTYKDVTGEIETTVTTLEDTFRLMQYIAWYKPFVTKLLTLEQYQTDGGQVWKTTYPLRNLEGYQAGFANAEQTEMITLVDLTFSSESGSSDKRSIILIVQGSEQAQMDTQALYDWVTQHVTLRDPE